MNLSFLVSLISLVLISFGLGAKDLDSWKTDQAKKSHQHLLQNLSPDDTVSGVVVASPSREQPNYFFHWVRDAALTMDVVLRLMKKSSSVEEKQHYFDKLHEFVVFSRQNQLTPNRSGGLGEPKFNVDGTAFDGDWGRPQNDGPALRAVVLIGFALELLESGNENYVRKYLYDHFDDEKVIQADLEYSLQNWEKKDFDLWEEVEGEHFYSRVAQRRAMMDGAKLAHLLGDEASAQRYWQASQNITKTLNQFWDPRKKIILATINRSGGVDYKSSGLDASIILASLHSNTHDAYVSPFSDAILATAFHLKRAFGMIYRLNQVGADLGNAIGRYPEDRYDGYHTGREGNPWFLTTLAFAEHHSLLRAHYLKTKRIGITEPNILFFKDMVPDDFVEVGDEYRENDFLYQKILQALKERSEAYFKRVRLHTHQETGEMMEQFNRHHGYMQGARHLTWSYSAFLTAYWASLEK